VGVDGLGDVLLPPLQPITVAPEARLTTIKTTPGSIRDLSDALADKLRSLFISFLRDPLEPVCVVQ
jgi:hypothetical protein